MAAPPVLSSGGTSDNRTTTEVLSTDACNVGDTLYIAYGSDAFDLASLPDATSDAGALTPLTPVAAGTNNGQMKRYLVVCTTPGVKQITYPAHSGCDIHGHWVRIGEACQVDTGTDQQTVNLASGAGHVAPGFDPNGTDRLMVTTWLTTSGPAFGEDPYVAPVSMQRRAETEASPFSDMLTCTQDLGAADGPTGTRTATWVEGLPTHRYMATSVALTRVTPGDNVTSTVVLGSSVVGGGNVTSNINLFSAASGIIGGGAPVSDVLCGPWATVQDVRPAVRAELAELTDQQLQEELMRASEILWALSGRRWYGEGCTETATLRSTPPMSGTASWPYHTSWGKCACWGWGTWQGGWLWPAMGDYRGQHHAEPFAIQLPRSPLASIVSVTVNGVLFTDWRMVRAGWLERTDGQAWHTCDDSTVIVYTFGEAPPAGGRDSAVELGVELAKAKLNLSSCRLPIRTTNVTRQGVTMTILDTMDFLDKGRTGLPGVDLWLAAVNPQATPQAATVWSPDLPTTIRSS